MEIRRIRFDDPENLADPSRIFIESTGDLELLDYARRYFERKGDDKSIRRAKEIRKYYKQIILDYVYIVRSIIPKDVSDKYFDMYFERVRFLRIEKEIL
jgi:hypothetical protein